MINGVRVRDSGVELSPTGMDRRGGPRTASNRTVRASSAIAAGSTRWLGTKRPISATPEDRATHGHPWPLIDAGFRRVRKVHGRTGRAEREEIVAEWRDGSLDLVVGTSAFGLGIDYPHARSVIHACVPETLDRFYQEVGRGGRDGKGSLSLIAPSAKDFTTAEKINAQQVIRIDRGLKRWSTMFAPKLPLSPGHFAVRIDGRPGTDERDIDMFGETNTDWNLRTVALMARAGLVRLLGTPYPRLLDEGDWLEIEIIDDHHLDKAVW
jgi:ATP-dependent DNA helicase RecQ